MPLYEYACEKCDHNFEMLVFNGDKVECPECASTKVERLLSVPARPQSSGTSLPMPSCGEGPPCGAPWCQRKQ
ncbi:MAG TPA: zinc ribbon domain-containing protein [Gemmataceae bacterium]|nr:zinc ribbon domain-containing protein [Gemmataceae bacterium]